MSSAKYWEEGSVGGKEWRRERRRNEGGREERLIHRLLHFTQVFYFQLYYLLHNCGFLCFSSLVSAFIQRLIQLFWKDFNEKKAGNWKPTLLFLPLPVWRKALTFPAHYSICCRGTDTVRHLLNKPSSLQVQFCFKSFTPTWPFIAFKWK